jgi:hypothetical protein
MQLSDRVPSESRSPALVRSRKAQPTGVSAFPEQRALLSCPVAYATRPCSHFSSIERVKRMWRPMRRQGSVPARTASYGAGDRVSAVGEWSRCGWPTVAALVGLEDEVFHHDPVVRIARAGERAHGASSDPLDRLDELRGGRDLEEHA